MIKRFIIVMLLFTLVGCDNKNEKPVIVVDAYPLEYIVSNIVGSDIDVINISDYTDPEEKMEKSSSAKLVLYVGDNYSGDIKNIANSVNVYNELHSKYESELFWISPEYMIKASEVIYQDIVNSFPNKKEEFLENYNEFEELLQEMHKEFSKSIANNTNKVYVNNSAFEYLLDYDLNVEIVDQDAFFDTDSIQRGVIEENSYDVAIASNVECYDCGEDSARLFVNLSLISQKPDAGNYLSEQYKNLLKLSRIIQ